MVTKEELEQFRDYKTQNIKTAYQVTAKELSHFIDDEQSLAELVADKKKQIEKENKITATAAYLEIEEKCRITVDTFKKAMCGNRRITRRFLYKFTVGLKMSLSEANVYFELCGGSLTRKNPEDYICMNALRDKDDINQLINDFDKHYSIKL